MKTNLHKIFSTSKKHETEGIWIQVDENVAFLCKRYGGENSSTIQKAIAKYHKPFASAIERNALSVEKSKEILVKIFVDSCVLDWKNITDDNGKDIPFTKEKCIELFLDLPELYLIVSDNAAKVENFKEDLGNF